MVNASVDHQRDIMRIKLRAIFILVAIAAVISAWLIQRTKPLPFCALVQIVDPVPSNRSTNVRNIDFENTFYLLLIKKLTDEHPKTLKGMSDPNSRLREEIRCELTPHGGNVTLYTVNVWGNAMSDNRRLETMMKTAVEVLGILSKDQSREFRTKILTAPSL